MWVEHLTLLYRPRSGNRIGDELLNCAGGSGIVILTSGGKNDEQDNGDHRDGSGRAVRAVKPGCGFLGLAVALPPGGVSVNRLWLAQDRVHCAGGGGVCGGVDLVRQGEEAGGDKEIKSRPGGRELPDLLFQFISSAEGPANEPHSSTFMVFLFPR